MSNLYLVVFTRLFLLSSTKLVKFIIRIHPFLVLDDTALVVAPAVT